VGNQITYIVDRVLDFFGGHNIDISVRAGADGHTSMARAATSIGKIGLFALQGLGKGPSRHGTPGTGWAGKQPCVRVGGDRIWMEKFVDDCMLTGQRLPDWVGHYRCTPWVVSRWVRMCVVTVSGSCAASTSRCRSGAASA